MALKIEVGDMFNAVVEDMASGKKCAIIHGCNAQGVMGSGVARIIKDNYPFAYTMYVQAKRRVGLKLGQVIVAKSLDTKMPVVYNAITQEHFGRDGKQYVNYDAVVVALQAIAKDVGRGVKVHLPLIGGGLGGGDKKRLIAIFQATLIEVDATLWLDE